jgi:hypothetical protein
VSARHSHECCSLRVTRLLASLVVLSIMVWSTWSIEAMLVGDTGLVQLLVVFVLMEVMELLVLVNITANILA